VQVVVRQGDLTGPQWRGLAAIITEYGAGRARTTQGQNLVLRWIPGSSLYPVWQALQPLGLGESGPATIRDIVSCPGTDSCKLGITASMGLNRAITERVEALQISDPLTKQILINISGCPNSCGQHHIASLGLYGGSRKFHGEAAPTYQLLVGGRTGGETRYGRPLARIPARLAPAAVKALLERYRDERGAGESFDGFTGRVGMERLAEIVAPFTELAPSAEAPEHYVDWEATGRFTPETGAGECAA